MTDRALTIDQTRDQVVEISAIDASSLVGDVVIAVEWSGCNFKDAMVTVPGNRVARKNPLIGGVDLAGRVTASHHPDVAVGTSAIVHGYGLGVSHDGGFATGLANASRGPGLLGHLFTARSAQLLEARSRGWAKDYLSGLLIGEEIGESLPLLESAAPPVLIGDPALTALYRQALLSFGRDALVLNGDACSIAGLQSLHQTLTTDPAP